MEQIMRIIHTADWHLGQNFYTKSRAAEHQAFLDWLLETTTVNDVDAIIVAGDIFDTGTPPSYARELYNRFVVRLQETGCALVILAGNHDSVTTLNESRELLACLNTQVIASARLHAEEQAVLLSKKDNTPGVILCPIPFLRPRDIQLSQAGLSGAEKQSSLMTAITEHYQQCYAAAVALRGSQQLPIIVTGHLTTVGVTKSDSVRDIYIGTLDAFPAQNFPPADYIALGHIHRAQLVGACEHIRYSGSPIALSFDESKGQKSVYLVEFSQGKLAQVDRLMVPTHQPLAVIKGSLQEIEKQLEQWRGTLLSSSTLSAHSLSNKVWLDIEITTDEYLHDSQRHIQQLTEDLPVEVLLLRRSRQQHQRVLMSQNKETLSELSTVEVFERRLAQEQLSETDSQRMRELFAHTLASLSNSL